MAIGSGTGNISTLTYSDLSLPLRVALLDSIISTFQYHPEEDIILLLRGAERAGRRRPFLGKAPRSRPKARSAEGLRKRGFARTSAYHAKQVFVVPAIRWMGAVSGRLVSHDHVQHGDHGDVLPVQSVGASSPHSASMSSAIRKSTMFTWRIPLRDRGTVSRETTNFGQLSFTAS